MFSGIVENRAEIKKITHEGSNIHFSLSCAFLDELYIDQSIAHDGVCLTVVKIDSDSYTVTAIQETLDKTNLKNWKEGDYINLERSLLPNSRIDGHFVQGHVDCTARCTEIIDKNGSWDFHFKLFEQSENYLVDKGSVCINGVSLTVVESKDNAFSVSIIPYTFENTSFNSIKPDDLVNIEFDILGKYIVKYMKKFNPGI